MSCALKTALGPRLNTRSCGLFGATHVARLCLDIRHPEEPEPELGGIAERRGCFDQQVLDGGALIEGARVVGLGLKDR